MVRPFHTRYMTTTTFLSNLIYSMTREVDYYLTFVDITTFTLN